MTTAAVATTIAQPADNQGYLAFAALDYARRGWPVFPCKPGSKEPATIHGFKDATTDLDQITRWWWYNPAANVAIATGAPGPDVLDVDVKPTGSGWAAFNRLKRAGLLTGAVVLVSTRNGGLHAYYAGTGQPSGAIRGQHLDFKARGGYVLAPPSTVPADDWAADGTGRYELIDARGGGASIDWARCKRLLTPPRPAPPIVSPGQPGSVDTLVRWVAQREHGEINWCLYWAAKQAALIGKLDDTAATDLVAAAAAAAGGHATPAGERESWRTIASARKSVSR
jgi:hypothetical protein